MALKYKAGDQVRIKSLDWYNKNIKNNGIIICGSESFTHPMSHFCDKVVTIVTIQDNCYRILEDDGDWYWTDEMIEGLVEEETKSEFKVGDKITNGKVTLTILILTPDRYLVKNNFGECGILYFNSQDGWKIVEEETKPKYELVPDRELPKTFEECVHVLEGENRMSLELMNTFRKLIDARNAYWKIAGDEMGLGKPWEPDLLDDIQPKFVLANWDDNIEKRDYSTNRNYILTFPSEEIRDAFYENFKEEIEICKELL